MGMARQVLGKAERTVLGLQNHEIRPVIGKAFGGTTIDKCETIIACVFKAFGTLSDKERQEMAACDMGFFAYHTIHKGGLAFGIQEDDTNKDGGSSSSSSLKAVVVFREYDPAKENHTPNFLDRFWSSVTDLRAYYHMKFDPLGLPELLKDSSQEKKFCKSGEVSDLIFEQFHEYHIQYAPQEKHWYIAIVATDPESHGKGYGKQVMNLMGQVADATGMACYLESPQYNQRFYEKCGYEVTKDVTVSVIDKELGEVSADLVLMTRKPQPSS